MKRLLALLISFALVFSLCATSYAADEVIENDTSVSIKEDIEVDGSADVEDSENMDIKSALDISVPDIENVDIDPSVDAAEFEAIQVDLTSVEVPEIPELETADIDQPLLEDGIMNLDGMNLSDVSVSSVKLQKASEEEISKLDIGTDISVAAENQAPVANPLLFPVNDETMVSGKPTTETVYYLLTRYNNEDLCYDPDGGNIEFVFNNEYFPSGYIEAAASTDGSLKGYIITMFNEGTYPLVFTFVDDSGAMSDIFSAEFNVLRRGNFERINNEFSSSADVNEHKLTVDYSVADSYQVGFLRTGKGGAAFEIYDEDGNKVKSNSLSGPRSMQYVTAFTELPKPEGVSGIYTYTVKAKAVDKTYVSGATSYRICFGEASQAKYFFEDVSDQVNLPYYNSLRNPDTQITSQYYGASPLSDYGNYYRFTGTGSEVVTLASGYGKYDFKILDVKNLETLFDSKGYLATFKPADYADFWMRIKINFEKDTDYYVVVYNSNGDEKSLRETYTITVGERRHWHGDPIAINIPSMQVTAGQSYPFSFTINKLSDDRKAFVDQILYRASMAGWPYEGNYIYFLTPGASSWKSSPKSISTIDFGYSDINTKLVRCDGDWKFRFTANKSGAFPGCKLTIYYYFEV